MRSTLSIPRSISLIVLSAFLFMLVPVRASAYYVQYKEQYYRLYHLHLNRYPDDTMENIYWLEQALKADFCNPLYAIALIENETEWEKYRYLFTMHLNLKLVEEYLALGNKWDKKKAYFYNAPWKEENLESLETAETCYTTARHYWDEAIKWATKAREKRFYFLSLKRVSFWEDEAYRIMEEGSLDYGRTIERELKRLNEVRETFRAMDENTY